MAGLLSEVREAEATGEVKALYEDIQHALRVSTVPWLFRVLATHPKYFAAMWGAIKPTLTNQFEGSTDSIRAHAVSQVAQSFQGSDPRAKLKGSGYARERIQDLQDQLRVYHYVNPKVCLITTVLREAFQGRSTPVRSVVVTPTGRGVPPGMPKIRRVDPQKVTGKAAEILASAQASLELPIVSDEFCTLAQWPEYLDLAWGDLKGIMQAAAYARVVEEVQQVALRGRQELSRRVDLAPEDLASLGLNDQEQSEIERNVEFFYRLSPQMVVNVAFWILALVGPEEAALSGEGLIRKWAVPGK